MKKLRVVFLGTPDFSVPALEMLAEHPLIEIVKVISMPDRPAGRGMELKSPEVIEYAKKRKLPLYQTENVNKDTKLIQELGQSDIDFCVVLAFAQFLSDQFLSIPKMGCFNIHTSLLPRYRGAAPIQYALLNGDKSTGVSIQKMVKKMDAGNIVHSDPVTISDFETGGLLYTRLKFQAALSLSEFINKLINKNLDDQKQNEGDVTFAPVLKKEDGQISFSTKSRHEILNQIRALLPWPGTYFHLSGKRLKVLWAEPVENKISPGIVKNDFGRLLVGCGDGLAIHLQEIQLEGKKACSDRDLLNGWKGDLEITKE